MNKPSVLRQRGLTLVESMVALSVTAVLAGIAVPGFDQARERRHLEGVAAQLETDLAMARSEAVMRGRSVRMDFQAEGGASCYVVHAGSAGDCSCIDGGAPVCRAGVNPLRSVHLAAGGPVTLASNSRSMLFDAHLGTVTPTGTVRITGARGDAVHQVVNIMGRVRSCSPALTGYARC